MVKVKIDEGVVTFNVQGLHKLWAFKGCVRVPITQIKDVRPDPTALKGIWKGWRFPGVQIPGLIVAGTYYRRKRKYFWDVSRRGKTIVVDTEGGFYDQLIVDVDDPEQVVKDLKSAIGQADGGGQEG